MPPIGYGRFWEPARETLKAWYDDSAPRWSAAIAFYTIFSLAPVLIIVIAVAGALWGDQAVRAEVMGQFRDLLGERGARQVDQLIRAALPQGSGAPATAAGVVTLLVGATAVFTTLRNALNAIWGVVPGRAAGVWQSVRAHLRTRLLSFALVLCMAFLLAASLVVSAGLSGLGAWMTERLPAPIPVLRLIEMAVTFAVLWLLFAVIFRWLPDAQIAWRDVWSGAATTALLFSAGKLAIGLYLGRSGLASALRCGGFGGAHPALGVLLRDGVSPRRGVHRSVLAAVGLPHQAARHARSEGSPRGRLQCASSQTRQTRRRAIDPGRRPLGARVAITVQPAVGTEPLPDAQKAAKRLDRRRRQAADRSPEGPPADVRSVILV